MIYFHTSLLCVNAVQKEDNILIKKSLYLLKGYTAQKLQKDFRNKIWNGQNLWRLLKNFRTQTSSADRRSGEADRERRECDLGGGDLMFSHEGASQS